MNGEAKKEDNDTVNWGLVHDLSSKATEDAARSIERTLTLPVISPCEQLAVVCMTAEKICSYLCANLGEIVVNKTAKDFAEMVHGAVLLRIALHEKATKEKAND